MASAFTPAGYQNIIDFVTFSTIGNAQDFGDLSTARAGMSMSCNSTTRGIFNGGYQPAPSTIRVNNMEFITFATTGNTQDFGDLTDDSQSTYGGTASSSTRGLTFGGGDGSNFLNNIDGTDLEEKLTSLSRFYNGELTEGGMTAQLDLDNASATEAVKKVMSYLVFYKTLTKVIYNFNAASAGFSFESFLSVLLQGKQIKANTGTIADFLTGDNVPISLKLYQ